MIVKNEAKNMERCLNSVPFVDRYIIVDTGSTDNTKQVIRDILKGKEEIYDRPWVNFGHNREEALQLAYKSGCDYAFIMDADFECQGTLKTKLTADSYMIQVKHGTYNFRLPLLFSLKKEWHWKGPVHNYLSGNGNRENLDDIFVISYIGQGAKSHGVTSKEKFMRDAELLKAELVKNPSDTRSTFYLAQSYKDAGETALAVEYYQKRALMGGWEEEVYWSLYQVARLSEFNVENYLRAYNYRPQRLEALHDLIRHVRLNDQPQFGYAVGNREIKTPADSLFMPADIEYKLKDELALCAYKIGKYREAYNLWDCLPQTFDSERIAANKKFALERISKPASYYDCIFKSADFSRYADIYSQVIKWTDGKVLDMGCGTAEIAREIKDYHGFDFSSEAVKKANNPNVKLGDIYTENLDGYDTYILIEVLEHVDDIAVLKRIPKGKQIIFSVPSFTDPSHIRTYTRESIVKRFGSLINIEEVIRFNWNNRWIKGKDTNNYILLVKAVRS